MPLTKRRINIAEEDLLFLLRERNQRGYAILYDNYSPALFGVIQKVVRDEVSAEDVLQDTFVKIWKAIDSYDRSKGTLFTWMLNIARNASIDRVRSQEYQQSEQNRNLEDSVYEADNIHQVENEIDGIGLRKLVGTLREEYRVLIELAYFQGHTQAEISEQLGVPLGTVKTRVKAALAELRKLLGLFLLLFLTK